jgi:hypothetical protein
MDVPRKEIPVPPNENDLDYLSQSAPSDEQQENEENIVDSITGEKVDLTDVVESAKTDIEKEVEESQKTSLVTEKLDLINSDELPANAPKLIRNLWKLSHDKLGEIAKIYAHTDNSNLVFEFKNGNKKIVSPQAIDEYSQRSFQRFNEKYLSKLENEQASEVNFEDDFSGKADTRDLQSKARPAEEPKTEKMYASLDEKSGTKKIKGEGKIVF